MKNNIVIITKLSCEKQSFLSIYTLNPTDHSSSPQLHILHLKDKFLIVTFKGLSKLAPFRNTKPTPGERARDKECQDEARPKRRELSHTTCNVVAHFLSLERGNSSERANASRPTCSIMQRYKSNILHNIYETKFILYFTYLYINISSLK